MATVKPGKFSGAGRGIPATPIGPFVTPIQLLKTRPTRIPKKAVVIARKCPRSLRTRTPIMKETRPAANPAIQMVTQNERPKLTLRRAET